MNLKEKHKKILKEIFQELLPELEIWVYGSRLENNQSYSGSDIDLVIKNDEVIDIKSLALIKEKISDSNIPFSVDIFDWNRIPEEFKENVLKNHYLL